MTIADELVTVRDLLRYAVSRFNAADLTYGHGTASALDEAVFLILEGLRLPVDDINPWLDARLTRPEREKLLGLFDARVEKRWPAPYLVGKAYIQGIPFRVDQRVIIPRSFIAELMLGPEGLVTDPDGIGTVLDLCTGSGCLAIIAAMCFPNAQVDAVDLSPDALEVARLNLADHDMAGRIELHQGNLFGPIEGRRYDLIVSNPPYVAEPEVAAFTPEYASEPQMAHLGGADGLDLVRSILAQAREHLTDGGVLVCEIGTGRHFIEEEYPDLPFVWLDTAESEGEVFLIDASGLRQTSVVD